MTQREVNYNQYAKQINTWNQKWWHDLEGKPIDRNKGEMFMLMLSELSEAMEGARKDLMDDHLPHRKMEEVEVADFVIRLLDYAAGFHYDLKQRSATEFRVSLTSMNKGERLFEISKVVMHIERTQLSRYASNTSFYIATAIIMCEEYCDDFGYDLWTAVDEKCAYNITRADHQLENRKKEGGKKW